MNKVLIAQSVSIIVPPEMRERFLKGVEYYGMKAKQKRGSDYITVSFSDPEKLYWLGANLYGDIPETSLTKRAF